MHWRDRDSRFAIGATDVDQVLDDDVVLAARLDPGLRIRHRELTLALIRAKHWESVGGLGLTAPVIATVAANAVIPILALDLSLYRTVQWIIIRPTAAISFGQRTGPATGVIADGPMSTIGQALPNSGPVSIAWDAALADSRDPDAGRNVVIHEFAHKIDMSDGYSDGTPPLHGSALTRWTDVLADEYGHAESRSSDAVLRGYAWANPAEFFAVATETFFCTPSKLGDAKPMLYRALCEIYRQDPAAPRSAD